LVDKVGFVIACSPVMAERAWDERTAGPAALPDLSGEEAAVLRRVVEAMRRVRFGSVLLVVQDARVVQIETAEKLRLR
jgi:hypothetical protein